MRRSVFAGIALALVGALTVGSVSAWWWDKEGGVAEAGAAPSTETVAAEATPRVTRVGDEALLNVRVFDTQRHLLLSTKADDVDRMNATKALLGGEFAFPALVQDAPFLHVVTNGSEPMAYGANASIPVGESLLGKPVGHRAAFPLVGRLPAYNETLVLDRTRGPFNLSMTVSNALLAELAPMEEDGRLVFDDSLVADVVERGEAASRIVFDVKDGEELPIRKAGLKAKVSLDAEAGRFWLRLDAPPDHAFSLNQLCRFSRYVLPPGSYRVAGVDEETLTLHRSPTKWPQLMEKDLLVIIEIADIMEGEPK